MSIDFDITTPNSAYEFLLKNLDFQKEELVMEYLVECGGDAELFAERNIYRIESKDFDEIHFIAFHVTGSLDDCHEIKQYGIRDLQYVLSQNTVLAKMLKRNEICFNIEDCEMQIDGKKFNIDYKYYRGRNLSGEEKKLEDIAYRIYYDFCIDGFWMSRDVREYGTDIHKRPEFLCKLTELSPKAERLDEYWKSNSKPYKVLFYANADQIHKFTFDLDENNEPYTDDEREMIKKWMLRMAVDQAFSPGSEKYIYIRDHVFIPPEQIISCELINSED